MTVKEAVARADSLYPNSFPFAIKEKWLSELDGKIFNELFCAYAHPDETSFESYSAADGGADRTLLVSFPYDDIYIKYLALRCDEASGDIGRYNNSAAIFNASYINFANIYNSSHKANSAEIKI